MRMLARQEAGPLSRARVVTPSITSSSGFLWTLVIGALVTISSLFGLLNPGVVYGLETKNWATQAQGQDVGNLLAVATLVIASWLYIRGSHSAGLVWLGSLFYVVYAFAVYAFAVHFNRLFLVYVAVLGLSIYAVLGSIEALRAGSRGFAEGGRFAGCTLVLTGALFGLLWLSELLPALVDNRVPQSVADAGLWVNPIHVIDLAVVLPGFVLTGASLLRGMSNGRLLAVPWLVFSALMGTSIVASMVLMTARGFAGTWPPMILVSTIVVTSLFAARRLLRGAD